jgi:hypothetical protein
MAPTELIAASAGAVLAPTFLGPFVAKLPGGAIGAIAAGAAGVYFGARMKEGGLVKGLLVGASAGIAISAIASMVIGQKVTASQ